MTDELDVQLRDALASTRLPSAPPSLSHLLTELATEAATEPGPHPRRRRWALGLAATLLIGVALTGSTVLLMGNRGHSGPPPPPAPTPIPSPSPSPDPLEGLHVYEVGELEEAMAGPNRPSGPIALRGFWTERSYGHSCPYFDHSETNLEVFCHDGEYGITQLNEPIQTITADHRLVLPTGPSLTPWIPDGIDAVLFGLPIVNDQKYTPVPIVVIGHIDDPRASECSADERQKCLDRFVIDEIVSFDPTSVPAPTPTPVPSPFPYDNPPPAPFAPSDCPGDTEYAFVGWKTMDEIGMWFPESGQKNEVVFVVITKHVIEVGNWLGEPGRRFRTMGQRVCFANEWERGGMTFTTVPGTKYREWDDGTHTPIDP
jgi:hypothetical protein